MSKYKKYCSLIFISGEVRRSRWVSSRLESWSWSEATHGSTWTGNDRLQKSASLPSESHS